MQRKRESMQGLNFSLFSFFTEQLLSLSLFNWLQHHECLWATVCTVCVPIWTIVAPLPSPPLSVAIQNSNKNFFSVQTNFVQTSFKHAPAFTNPRTECQPHSPFSLMNKILNSLEKLPPPDCAVHLFSWHIFSRKHVLNCSAADLHHNHVPLSCELLVEGHGPH